MPYLLAADAVLLLHVLFVAFVVVGLLLILAGRLLSWDWVRNWWFRVIHLGAIGIVVGPVFLALVAAILEYFDEKVIAPNKQRIDAQAGSAPPRPGL